MTNAAGNQCDFGYVALRLPAGDNGTRKFRVVRYNQDAGLVQVRRPHPIALGLELFCFLDNGKQTLGADSEIYSSFRVFRALCRFDAPLEIGNFAASKR